MFNNINMKYKTGVSKLTGAMGPKTEALWPKINGTTGAIYSMGASPLIYNTTTGIYNTAYDANAAVSSPSFKKFSYGKKRRKSKKKSKRRKRRSKRRSKRKSGPRPTKKWKNPSRKQRKAMMGRCGASCFLHPDELNFPVCNPDCSYNSAGLEAAYKRAKQWGYTDVAKKAKSLMKKKGKSRKRSVKRRSRKTRRRRSFGAYCVGNEVYLRDGEEYDQNNQDHQYGACEPGGSLYCSMCKHQKKL